MTLRDRNMAPGCECVVRPAGAGVETRLVLLVAFLTVMVCGGSIFLRTSSARVAEVSGWQVDAFNDLRAEELALFNGLYTAAPEIMAFHDDSNGQWPSVTDLETDLIPPFIRDSAWRKNGAMEWSNSILSTKDKHIALYVGHPQDSDISGSFLLVILHDHVKKEGNAGAATHAPFEVWLHPSPVAETPTMVTDQALINKGWREVVARKGEDEMKRMKGEDYL
ncbi:hypothetical protein GO013_06430 [Pseudodesulfovibrio sp. JC047]|uniref:DUF6162 family protein n=1 Tax=Pseudodesulfovibrio sp. JC047 TaxID=2683199 RepID=UPI0013D12BF8|nr:hypothetical protein [Pseudodesulfovibrio sp. JC047]NDV19055.1 hypothetical protein [Pseudodesulfovibrio sp. JC047]